MALMVVGCKDGRIPDLARNASPLLVMGGVVVSSELGQVSGEEVDEAMVVSPASEEEDVMGRRYDTALPLVVSFA